VEPDRSDSLEESLEERSRLRVRGLELAASVRGLCLLEVFEGDSEAVPLEKAADPLDIGGRVSHRGAEPDKLRVAFVLLGVSGLRDVDRIGWRDSPGRESVSRCGLGPKR